MKFGRSKVKKGPGAKPVDRKPLPEDLAAQAGAINALENTERLIRGSLFPGGAHDQVAQSLAFLGALKSQELAKLQADERYAEYFGG